MAKLMKGETWADGQKLLRGKPRFNYPVFVEPKIDEVRCRLWLDAGGNIRWDSYAEKPLANMEFLNERVMQFFLATAYYELDIGIEVNGNFNDSYRWVRSSKNLPADLDQSMVKLWVFDIPTSDEPYFIRAAEVANAAIKLRKFGVPAGVTVASIARDANEVDMYFKQYIQEGFEGAMVKTSQHKYQLKRSFDWMKLKPSAEEDGVITEILEAVAQVEDPEAGIAVGDPLGRAGSVRVRMPDGSEATPHGIVHSLGTDMFQNPGKYIGKWCMFKYMERDRQGGYRHPVFQRVREDK